MRRASEEGKQTEVCATNRVAAILAILICGAVLIAYVIVEKRINQRACLKCGFKASIDGLDEVCPRCGSLIPQHRHANS